MKIRGRILVPIWKAPGFRTCFQYKLFRNFFLDFSRKYFNDSFIDLYTFMNLSEDPSNNFSEDSFCKSPSNLSRNYSSNILKDAKKSLSVSSRKSFNSPLLVSIPMFSGVARNTEISTGNLSKFPAGILPAILPLISLVMILPHYPKCH